MSLLPLSSHEELPDISFQLVLLQIDTHFLKVSYLSNQQTPEFFYPSDVQENFCPICFLSSDSIRVCFTGIKRFGTNNPLVLLRQSNVRLDKEFLTWDKVGKHFIKRDGD